MEKINSQDKTIYLYISHPKDKIPLIIYNCYEGDGFHIYQACMKRNCPAFALAVISGIDWNNEMTPYYHKSLFKNGDDYLGEADQYLDELIKIHLPVIKERLSMTIDYSVIAGYSLGGLFALYSLYQSAVFDCALSASGSLWYPHFDDYIKHHEMLAKPRKIYLSLGNKEKKSRNKTLAGVELKTLEFYNYYKDQNINVFFELNEGNHFKDEDIRIAKGIEWILK